MAVAAAAPAQAATAEDYVKSIAGDVMALANTGQKGPALKGKFAALMNRYINLKAVADDALGPYSKKLPANRRAEFYDLVSNYAAALFVGTDVDDFRGSELEIVSSTQQGKFTIIQSAITGKGNREQVRWRLVVGSGFKISDVNLKGVWLTISMKDRFSKVLNKSKGDFVVLFAELREANTW